MYVLLGHCISLPHRRVIIMTVNPSDLLPKSSSSSSGKKLSGGSGNNISEDWTSFRKNQILSIGKKKRHNNNIYNNHRDDGGDEDDDSNNAVGGGNDSSSDEEEGRTAIREKKKKKKVQPITSTSRMKVGIVGRSPDGGSGTDNHIPATSKQKKKKKGKMERAKEAAVTTIVEANDKDTTTKKYTTYAQKSSIAKEVEEGGQYVDKMATGDKESNSINDDADTKAANATTKRYRKKVRSRQKNIRKDHRTIESKPKHLVLGSGVDYAGRPMTTETRMKLGLEEKVNVESDGKNSLVYPAMGDKTFDSGKWIGDETDDDGNDNKRDTSVLDSTKDVPIMQQSQSRDNQRGGRNLTKIGDCIVSSPHVTTTTGEGQDVGENIQHEEDKGTMKKLKKAKKQKKRKFKNLQVG